MQGKATRYVIGRRLGAGGMAEVFEAVESGADASSRRVALKRIRSSLLALPEARRAFLDEALVARALHHPNIVSILDYGTVDDVPFQVFELVDGLNLRELRAELVKSGHRVSADLAFAVGLSIAEALAYAHELRDARGAPRGIVHRDVSPQNVLISWSGEVKLADFGIALAAERRQKTATGMVKGNASYMAPEQARGGEVDARADVFALGCVLHWFVRGVSPIEGPGALSAVISGSDPPIDAAIDSDLATILRDATRAALNRRTPNARAIAESLAAGLASRAADDPRGLVLRALGAARERAQPPPSLEDLFAPAIELTQEEEGLRRFASIVPEATEVTWTGFTQPSGPTRREELEDDDLEVGMRFGPLELVERISHGGMAIIYRAEHVVLGRHYAVKILRKRSDSPANRTRLEREARALASVAHPHVVAIHDFGTTPNGRPFLVTELLEGSTLREVLKAGPGRLSIDQLLIIAAQLASALEHIHALGLVHRDLKPSNVMLVSESPIFVKLIDFGIARLASLANDESHLTSLDDLLGTPGYMAPEQIRDPTLAEARSDLYALGCVLYVLIARRPPFKGTWREVLELQLRQEPPALPAAEGLELLVGQLLRTDIEQRPKSAAQVSQMILELAQGRGETNVLTRANTPSVPRIGPSGGVARWGWAVSAAVVWSLLVAIVIRASLPSQQDPPPALPAAVAEVIPDVASSTTAPVSAAARPAVIEDEGPSVERLEPPRSGTAPVRKPRPRAPPDETWRELELKLRALGLSPADLVHYSAVAPELRRHRDAGGSQDARQAALNRILSTIEASPPPKSLLQARLDEVGRQLGACAGTECGPSLASVESEYLEIRVLVARPGGVSPESRSLLKRTARLVEQARALRAR